MLNKIKNKNAAIGATITWVVATIIILLVIIIFVYAAGVLAAEKRLGSHSGKNFYSQSTIAEQNLLAIMQTKINEKTIEQIFVDGEQKVKREEIVNLLNKIPNCFIHNIGGAWEMSYFKKGESENYIIRYSVTWSNLQPAKFNSVLYSETNAVQINEICKAPERFISI